MARIRLFLTLAALCLLNSCAEIIPLTGGDEDTSAPAPVKQAPEQGTTQFTGNSVSMTFNEFLRLNDVSNTITMNPSVGKLTTEQKNRTVIISWEEPLKPNTTYILQLNGAIRDLNEGNDSIMTVVFATGTVIDSMSFSGKIVNAYSNQTMNQVSVGLYAPGSDPYAVKPVYATRSDKTGEFRFSYLKDEPFSLFAFVDQNKDQLPQVNETIGFLNDSISVSDTTPVVLQVFAPVPVRNKLKIDFVPPGLLVAYNLTGIHAERLTVNNEPVELVKTITNDSILVTLPASGLSNYEIIYGNDTLRKTLVAKDRMIPLVIRPIEQTGKWQDGDSLLFRVNDQVQSINREAVHILTEKGTPVTYQLIQKPGEWEILPDGKTDQRFTIHFDKGAVTGAFGVNDSITFSYETLRKGDLSNLKINCPDFTEGEWVVELVQNEKTIYSAIKPAGAAFVEFKSIVPGQYSVRCIHDLNHNGKWDPGSYLTKMQSEEVLRYTLTQKLRPNWDIEETLQRKP